MTLSQRLDEALKTGAQHEVKYFISHWPEEDPEPGNNLYHAQCQKCGESIAIDEKDVKLDNGAAFMRLRHGHCPDRLKTPLSGSWTKNWHELD